VTKSLAVAQLSFLLLLLLELVVVVLALLGGAVGAAIRTAELGGSTVSQANGMTKTNVALTPSPGGTGAASSSVSWSVSAWALSLSSGLGVCRVAPYDHTGCDGSITASKCGDARPNTCWDPPANASGESIRRGLMAAFG